MTSVQKLRTAAALVVVFLLIIATNLIDRHHFTIVQSSLTSIYEDRLMAKNYIYKMARQVQIKRNILETKDLEDAMEMNNNMNDSIRVLMVKYENTRLTELESKHFASLQETLNRLFQYEENYVSGEVVSKDLPTVNSTELYYAAILEDLDALSEIQIGEGRRELALSTKSIDTSNLISKIEIGVLILIGLLLQLLIFLKPMK